ncbi:MAG: hypothetical protein ACI8QG_002985 [Flavobacteriales bacterium]|jgi:hypothetical protein
MNTHLRFLGILTIVLLSSCSSKALFVTSTSVGINFDATTQTASIAYDREEGYIGPTYETDAPSAVAYIQSDGEIFAPKIKQTYATGEAASIVTGASTYIPGSTSELSGENEVMFFGTNTTSGFKIGFATGTPIPNELVFGFKRKEVSHIPLIKDGNGKNRYASTLAFYSMTRDSSTAAPYSDKQYIALGEAAKAMADKPSIKSLFERSAIEISLAEWDTLKDQQRALSEAIAGCYDKVPLAKIPSIWTAARYLNIIKDDVFLDRAEVKFNEISKLDISEPDKSTLLYRYKGLKGPSEWYLSFVRTTDGTEESKKALVTHLKQVCKVIA